MLDALIRGERDPLVLAQYAQRRMRSKIPELVEALTGRFSNHHAFLAQLFLTEIDTHTRTIEALTERIEGAIRPFQAAREALVTIPGVSTLVADVIIAETGADMAVFQDAGHLASWAGVCPGLNESAGRIKSFKTMPGNRYLKAALGIAARRGPVKAVVALEHTILNAVWNMLSNGQCFEELGSDYYARLNPDALKARALQQLRKLGYDVIITSPKEPLLANFRNRRPRKCPPRRIQWVDATHKVSWVSVNHVDVRLGCPSRVFCLAGR